jgi:hypothetical protein
MGNIAAVIGMGGSTGSNHPVQKTGYDYICGGAAYALFWPNFIKGADPAWTHGAVTAA